MKLIYYRPGIYYHQSINDEKRLRFWTGLTNNKKEAITQINTELQKCLIKLYTLYDDKNLYIEYYYMPFFDNTYIKTGIEMLAVGCCGEVYELSSTHWMYRWFHIKKNNNIFAVFDHNNTHLKNIEFDDTTESDMFEEALGVIDDYFHNPKYLRDTKFNNIGFIEEWRKL